MHGGRPWGVALLRSRGSGMTRDGPAAADRTRGLHLGTQEGLGTAQLREVAVARDAGRPVVAEEHVQRRVPGAIARARQLAQPEHLQLAHVVCTAQRVGAVGQPLPVALCLCLQYCILQGCLKAHFWVKVRHCCQHAYYAY